MLWSTLHMATWQTRDTTSSKLLPQSNQDHIYWSKPTGPYHNHEIKWRHLILRHLCHTQWHHYNNGEQPPATLWTWILQRNQYIKQQLCAAQTWAKLWTHDIDLIFIHLIQAAMTFNHPEKPYDTELVLVFFVFRLREIMLNTASFLAKAVLAKIDWAIRKLSCGEWAEQSGQGTDRGVNNGRTLEEPESVLAWSRRLSNQVRWVIIGGPRKLLLNGKRQIIQ